MQFDEELWGPAIEGAFKDDANVLGAAIEMAVGTLWLAAPLLRHLSAEEREVMLKKAEEIKSAREGFCQSYIDNIHVMHDVIGTLYAMVNGRAAEDKHTCCVDNFALNFSRLAPFVFACGYLAGKEDDR